MTPQQAKRKAYSSRYVLKLYLKLTFDIITLLFYKFFFLDKYHIYDRKKIRRKWKDTHFLLFLLGV